MSRRTARYTEEEVRALIEGYAELKEKVDTTRPALRYLVMLVDLKQALEYLPRKYWEVVLLHGLFGLTLVQTAELLQVSHQAVSKRYRRALEDVTYIINGGDE